MKYRFLFNPFEKIAGVPSLLIGLAAMLLAGFVGYQSKTHFDGILNIHSGIQASWYVHLSEPFISVLSVALWFVIFSLIFSKPTVRMVDIVGTQCFAFVPLLPTSLLGFAKIIDQVNAHLQDFVANQSVSAVLDPLSLTLFIILMILVLILTVWSAIWIYNGFKVASNLPNKILIPVYVSGLVIGMIVPKIIISVIS